MFQLLALSAPFRSSRAYAVLERFGREVSTLLDALTHPVQFVAEVEAAHCKPGSRKRLVKTALESVSDGFRSPARGSGGANACGRKG